MIETEEVCAPKATSMEYAFHTKNDVVWRCGSRCEHRADKSTVSLDWPTPSGEQSQRVLRVSGRKQISIVGIMLLFLSPTWHDEVSTAGSYCYGLGKYPPF